jgi:hypothetical protein
MKLKDFSHLLLNAAVEGASKALDQYGGLPAHISKAEAYRLYGRGNVDRWVSEGLIIPAIIHGKAFKKILDRIQLDRVAASSNRNTYLPVADRV